ERETMKTHLSFLTCASVLLFVILTGCGGPDTALEGPAQAEPPGAKARIGVVLLTRTHPFYQDLEAAMQSQAEQEGLELLVSTGEFDVARQKDQMADFIVRKVDEIVVCPADSTSIGTSVKAANDAGIPVFTADIKCLAEGVDVKCHVATDNLEGGRLAAQALREAIGGSGQVAIIDHPEVESVILRTKGFREEAAKTPEVEIVATLPGGGVKDKAFKAGEDLLQAHPELDGIFGINDDSALGALAAVEKAGKQGEIMIVGFDAVPEAREAIKAGKIYADVIQKPEEIGRKTIQVVAQYMGGEEIPKEILIPCALYTKESPEG
ncbi:MAG: substrate-binding domain-containing protein, partial [Candidatus Hydrogenedentes bacterium]|nr:substrate-binding domain-containing protein [Candidatus Hydrogenedentota bacterium]